MRRVYRTARCEKERPPSPYSSRHTESPAGSATNTAGELSESEAAELAVLRDELLAAEADYLLPAAERLGEESAMIERQNQELEALLRRKTALAQRLERVLVEAQAEREAIEGELAAVLVSRGI